MLTTPPAWTKLRVAFAASAHSPIWILRNKRLSCRSGPASLTQVISGSSEIPHPRRIGGALNTLSNPTKLNSACCCVPTRDGTRYADVRMARFLPGNI